MAPPRVAVIIPVWNEAAAIPRVLAEVPPGAAQQVIVVDGGSRDGTVAAAQQAGARVLLQSRRGYGAACWEGALAAEGCEILVYLDGDYSDPPAAIPALLQPLLAGQAALALGVRTGAAAALPWHARLGNRLITLLIWLLCRHRFSDLPSFKAIRRDLLLRLDMHEMSYGWTAELLVKAARLKVPVVEVPVLYRPRLGGRSKVSGNVRASVLAAWHLIATTVRYARW